ncbi:MAG: ribonuclease H-like domain-containing protein [Sphingomicrobium sp.]
MTLHSQRRSGSRGRLAVLDIETIAPPVVGEGFPPWPTHTPVVASILTADWGRYGQWRFALESVDFLNDPGSAIERVSHLIEGRDLVTYNGRGFDVPVLALTAMKHQRFDLAGISEGWQAHRFSGRHFDLADIVSGFGGARGASLEMLCDQLGIPAKQDCHGSDVAELVAKREFEVIRHYCESDVIGTAMAFACVEGFRSRDASFAATMIAQLSRWIADCGYAHLEAFERIAGHEEYDRLSLIAMLEEGISALDHRQQLKFVTNLPGASGVFVPQHSDF